MRLQVLGSPRPSSKPTGEPHRQQAIFRSSTRRATGVFLATVDGFNASQIDVLPPQSCGLRGAQSCPEQHVHEREVEGAVGAKPLQDRISLVSIKRIRTSVGASPLPPDALAGVGDLSRAYRSSNPETIATKPCPCNSPVDESEAARGHLGPFEQAHRSYGKTPQAESPFSAAGVFGRVPFPAGGRRPSETRRNRSPAGPSIREACPA